MSQQGKIRDIASALAVLALALLSACNSGTVLSTPESEHGSLIGARSGDLHVVAQLPPPEYMRGDKANVLFRNDLLKIIFLDVDQLNRTTRIDTNGTLQMPLIGEVQAAGLSTTELERVLEQRYGRDYLQSPNISVAIRHSTAHTVSMDGAFRRPGTFPVTEHTTLLQAVSQAGGLSQLADEAKIYMFRRYANETRVARVSLAAIREGRAPNPRIYPRDIVVAFRSKSKVALNNLRQVLGVAGSAKSLAVPF